MLEAKGLEAAKAVFNKTYVEKDGPLKAAISAYLEAVVGGPVQAPAVRVKMRRCATEGCDNPASVYFERGGVGSHYCSGCGMKIESRSALEAETGGGEHPDDLAVDRFAIAMKAKLKWEREERNRSGWQDMSAADLSRLLYEHLPKGDPIDVANLAMMLHQNGQQIEAPATTTEERAVEALTEAMMLELFGRYDPNTNYHTWIDPNWSVARSKIKHALAAALAGSGDGWRREAEKAMKAALEYLRGQDPNTVAGGHGNGDLRNRLKWVLLGCGGPLRSPSTAGER